MAGSDAKWTGSSTGSAVVVDWSTEYSGDDTDLQPNPCTFTIDNGNDASTAAKKLKNSFNAANPGTPATYWAIIEPGNPKEVKFHPPEDVSGMSANGHELVNSTPWTIVPGMTVQEFEPI